MERSELGFGDLGEDGEMRGGVEDTVEVVAGL